jgi:tripartite-type tricarboxylate transporter receptor subunit TctC
VLEQKEFLMLTRRKTLQLAASTVAMPLVSSIGRAQAYPNKPVRLIVGFPAGGPNDNNARMIAPLLSEKLGQQFIVENRAGASGTLATAAVVRSAADGYTLLLISSVEVITATLYDKAGFDFERDIVPVAGLSGAPFVMIVNQAFPARTVPEFIAYAKANPGKVNMGSAGNGTPQHVYGELFKLQAGVNLMHVPYRGSAPALTDLVSGQVHVIFEAMSSSVQYMNSGHLRGLAVANSTRLPGLDLPTVSEFVPGFEMIGFTGIGVPRGTPRDIIEKLNREINLCLDDPKIKSLLDNTNRVALKGSPGQFAERVSNEIEKAAKAIKAANIKAE